MTRIFARVFVAAIAMVFFSFGIAEAGLPSGWMTADIGAVGAAGSASGDTSALTVDGSGADVWGAADAFRFVYTTLPGDGSIIAQVTAEQALNDWTKAGVMMRETLDAGSRQAFMLVSPGKGLAFQRRASTNGASTNTSGGAGAAPMWVKLTRSGGTFTAYESVDGASWKTVGSQSISMASTIYVGVAVTSHAYGSLAEASFASTTISTPLTSTADAGASSLSSVPAWSAADIGSVGAPGTAAGTLADLDATGAGADVWGSADAFRFVYTPMSGDGSVVTHVTSEQHIADWTKAGVMMRETLSPGSRHAFMLVSPGKGLAFQRRTTTGGDSVNTAGGSGSAPYWVKLTRSGTTFTAYRSTDGATWTKVGSQTITMASTIYVGVAVSSHVYGKLASAIFDSTAVGASTSTTTGSSTDTGTTSGTTSGSSTSTSTSSGSSSGSSTTLRVMTWNTHHGGIRTDGVYDPALIASWIAKINPEIVSLNEVDTTDAVNAIVKPLDAATGVNWTVSFSGKGNVALTRLPVDTIDKCVYPDGVRYSAHLETTKNGRAINFWVTHTTVDSASTRLAEVKQLQSCASNWSEARILAGDFNMQAGSTEYNQAVTTYKDAWPTAKALGTAINFAGNCDGCTRNSRIDYIFASKTATFLTLKSAQVFDVRDANGVMPSDHRPTLVIYTVN